MKIETAEFPDWFGPMLVKELRQGLKARGFVNSFIGFQLILAGVMIYHVLLYQQVGRGFDSSGLSAIFWMLIGAQLLLVTPLRALNELATERKANTLELIFMSGLTAWRIAFGKWVSLLFQALLFLLAILPYTILRYYFGGINLAEDLLVLLGATLACAVLSAVALAISGLPLFARVSATILAIFGILSWIPMMFVRMAFGRTSLGVSSSGPDVSFWLVSFETLVLCAIALEIGAATIAPLAENHAGRQRFLGLLSWAPLPYLLAIKAEAVAIYAQMAFSAAICGIIAWHHLSGSPTLLRSYCRPFRGWRALAGIPFLPGWPSAVVFVILAVGLLVGLPSFAPMLWRGDERWFLTTILMLGAALLSGALLWVLLRRRARRPLIEQSVFLILCAAITLMIRGAERPSFHLGEHPTLAALPAVGVFAMFDLFDPARANWAATWFKAAAISFCSYATLLLALSWKYWRSYFSLCRLVNSAPVAEVIPEPISISAE